MFAPVKGLVSVARAALPLAGLPCDLTRSVHTRETPTLRLAHVVGEPCRDQQVVVIGGGGGGCVLLLVAELHGIFSDAKTELEPKPKKDKEG